jgi:hypothetical protein
VTEQAVAGGRSGTAADGAHTVEKAQAANTQCMKRTKVYKHASETHTHETTFGVRLWALLVHLSLSSDQAGPLCSGHTKGASTQQHLLTLGEQGDCQYKVCKSRPQEHWPAIHGKALYSHVAGLRLTSDICPDCRFPPAPMPSQTTESASTCHNAFTDRSSQVLPLLPQKLDSSAVLLSEPISTTQHRRLP